ncbi:hypothetical protein [Dyella japonica]|uniref:Uncharacterized protein n=1 Tax=Dyella japonica DSM 16301 TaxID=1440762 RepID=A0A0G9H473_9GAMM|nr:hypothetical protein [Dyella japonica]KLD64276.1 hypothetical protein Y882_07945 [Dyella japonica DSM 16301]
MKHTTFGLALTLLFSCTTAAIAADNAKTLVVRDYTDSVAPADQEAYEAGIKAFNQCLSQHGFKYNWGAWVHETGDTYAYSYVTDPLPWSAFDAMRTAGKACDGAIRTGVNPHLKSEISAFMEIHPELSHMANGQTINQPYIEVISFKLKQGHEAREAFLDVVKKITAAADKSKWPNYYATGEIRDAGGDAPDFQVLIPAKSWEEIGKEPATPLWAMVESVYGKPEAQAMRKSLNDAVQEQNSHVDSYNTDLSYKASGK